MNLASMCRYTARMLNVMKQECFTAEAAPRLCLTQSAVERSVINAAIRQEKETEHV